MTRPSPALKRLVPTLDWERIRFPGELELRREVERLTDLKESLLAWTDPRRLGHRLPPEFPWGGLIATPSTIPAVHRAATLLRRTLRLDDELEIHVFPSSRWLVDLLPTREKGVLRLGVSSFAVERLWLRESLFAFGRSLGRRLHQQFPLRADPAAGLEGTSRETLLSRGIWRFQELSCDRVGMLCCQDPAIAARAIFKSASGLPNPLIHVDLEDILHQRVPEEDAMVGHREHDFTLLRVASLLRFANSELYAKSFQPEPAIDDVAPSVPIAHEPATSSASTPLPTPAEAVGEIPSPAPPSITIAPVEATPAADAPLEESSCAPMPAAAPPPTDAPTAIDSSANEERDSEETPLEHGDPHGNPMDPRTFCLHAALWIVSLSDEISDAQREVLESTFGPDFLAEIKPLYEKEGEAVFETTARRLAPSIATWDEETKRWLLRDLVQVASADGCPSQDALALLREMSSMLRISTGELSMLTAEFLDPEFADYQFDVGQAVEVLLDGRWVEGVVRHVDVTGDLKIEFREEKETLKFNPTADLVRPAELRQAG